MRALLLGLCLVAGPVPGQGIDFAAVMAQHAADVETPAPGMRVLELPGPVIVTCRNGVCTGMDQSPHGAAGCAVRVLTEMAVLDQLCPDVLDTWAKARLRAGLDEGWRFWADNTLPRVSHADALALRETTMATRRAQTGLCPIDGSGQGDDLRQLLLSVTRETSAGRLARTFETPRLPVTNPCL